MDVCVHRHVGINVGAVAQAQVCVCVHMEARDQPRVSFILQDISTWCVRQGLRVLKLTYFPRLPGHQAPLQPWDSNIHCHTQLFTQVLGNITAVCMFAWQALNQLSSLFNPKFCFSEYHLA